jgi:ABC-type amino acid transport substrate-binding protein
MSFLRVIACFFALLLFPSLLMAKDQERETFVVGTTSAYAPYVSLNDRGEYEGFDIDLAHLIAQKLNKKLVIQDLGSMPSLLMALQKKKVDALIWAISITEKRQKEMEMIYYQGEKVTEMPFIFWKQAPQEMKKIEDLLQLDHCTICVEAGSYQDAVLQKYPSLNVRFLDKVTDSIMELKYGKAKVTTVDHSLIPRIQAQYPEAKVVYLPLPEEQQSLGNGVCLRKEDRELSTKIRQIINDLIAEGKIGELEKKWNLTK